MHPAKSVIGFTTASGAGYGLLVWLAIAPYIWPVAAEQSFGLVAFGIAFTLVVGGLLSSTLHLGHPERAWRAMSQWRSSWLSREGVAAIVTFAPTGLYALSWVFMGENGGTAGLVGLAGAILSLITVYCTAMIYASLKAIPAWHNAATPPAYLVLSLMTGGLLFLLLSMLWGYDFTGSIGETLLLLLAAGLLTKIYYWHKISSQPTVSTAESATGLGQFGKVSLLESPHSSANYLLKEMGFQIARKHASKLRVIAVATLFLVPIAVLLSGALSTTTAIVAVSSATVGIITERWLFFAEAKHAVTLYYGESEI